MDKKALGLDPKKQLVVIVAGSLGSSTVNEKMKDFLSKVGNEKYEVLYITGNALYNDFTSGTKYPSNVKVLPYLDNLPALLKNTDLIVTRAGASTMSEILVLNVPTIFIPSPYVTNNHQYKNAMDLVEKNAALILEEKDLTKDKLIDLIDNTLNNKDEYNKIKNNLNELGIENSAEKIYEVLKGMIMDDKKFFWRK